MLLRASLALAGRGLDGARAGRTMAGPGPPSAAGVGRETPEGVASVRPTTTARRRSGGRREYGAWFLVPPALLPIPERLVEDGNPVPARYRR